MPRATLADGIRSVASIDGEREPRGLRGPGTSTMRADLTLADRFTPPSELGGELLATDTLADVIISAFS